MAFDARWGSGVGVRGLCTGGARPVPALHFEPLVPEITFLKNPGNSRKFLLPGNSQDYFQTKHTKTPKERHHVTSVRENKNLGDYRGEEIIASLLVLRYRSSLIATLDLRRASPFFFGLFRFAQQSSGAVAARRRRAPRRSLRSLGGHAAARVPSGFPNWSSKEREADPACWSC